MRPVGPKTDAPSWCYPSKSWPCPDPRRCGGNSSRRSRQRGYVPRNPVVVSEVACHWPVGFQGIDDDQPVVSPDSKANRTTHIITVFISLSFIRVTSKPWTEVETGPETQTPLRGSPSAFEGIHVNRPTNRTCLRAAHSIHSTFLRCSRDLHTDRHRPRGPVRIGRLRRPELEHKLKMAADAGQTSAGGSGTAAVSSLSLMTLGFPPGGTTTTTDPVSSGPPPTTLS